ncbi:BCL2 interacting protein 3 [Dermatophagoides farinae]|uniref:Bcl2/adenovirus e1b 19 kDa protein-interacting protein 3-like protein n=1 Tax=Dermatophagoides farinae TaxID=6954 RepID=A0A922IFC4_DERFA|nr:BCL2/adenovirus E1B 19 kDa protein-interacting protein 3-like [Dermatophagoides farinae]KAH7636236.1 bcl2/adenovirus e1b 19 kda protein-interacting protein 3-like protein [Dermatophagoides farinae]KAH9528284.1 bnip3 [Dermatophagoides farinae]
MASTPKSDDVVSLNDSWIDINENSTYSPSDTPLHILVKNNGPTLQSLEKLLLDAQKESQTGHSSLKGSFLGSLPITPDGLQTPPNSIYFNNNEHNDRSHLSTDWIWDWSNRDPLSKEWNNIQPNRKTRPTFRQWIIRRGILSKEVLSLLFLTNILSLILGAGIGYTIILRRAF